MRVGQSVLYSPPRGARYFGCELAAIVACVNENGSLNLVIFDPDGNVVQNPPTHIPVSSVGCMPDGGCCWVPQEVTFYDVPAPKTIGPGPTEGQLEAVGGKYVVSPQIPMPELPPGAKLVENRPATPEEIAAAKGSASAQMAEMAEANRLKQREERLAAVRAKK